MLQNLQNIAKFQNFQLDNLVDFEKCCKTRISVAILAQVPVTKDREARVQCRSISCVWL